MFLFQAFNIPRQVDTSSRKAFGTEAPLKSSLGECEFNRKFGMRQIPDCYRFRLYAGMFNVEKIHSLY